MAAELPKQMFADIFPKFQANAVKMTDLKSAYDAISAGYQGMCLRPLLIQKSDADRCRCFSKAYCESEGLSPNFTVGSVFATGKQVLKLFLAGNVPRDETMQHALDKLLIYMTPECAPSELTSAVFGTTALTDVDFTLLLAQHLLSKLAVSPAYIVDRHYGHKARNTRRCPCTKNDPLTGVFGDTSFGCTEGWHGNCNIMIDSIPVTVTSAIDDGDNTATTCGCEEHLTLQEHRLKAQTITNSFLHKKQDPNLRSYLVPSIGISRKKILINFYDCDNDVFLTSAKLDLFSNLGKDRITFNHNAIVLLWITLNYRMFCSGASQQMKEKRSSFLTLLGDNVEMYRNDVKRPCACRCSQNTEDDSWIWAHAVREPVDDDEEDIEYESLF